MPMNACAWKYPKSAKAFAATCAAVFECPSPDVMAEDTNARPEVTARTQATPFWSTVLPLDNSASTHASETFVFLSMNETCTLASRSGTVYVMPGMCVRDSVRRSSPTPNKLTWYS